MVAVQNQPVQPAGDPPRRNRPVWLIPMVAALLLVVLLWGAFAIGNSRSKKNVSTSPTTTEAKPLTQEDVNKAVQEALSKVQPQGGSTAPSVPPAGGGSTAPSVPADGSTSASSVPSSGTASPALRTPYRTPTAQPSMVTGTREFVCENIWSGVQCDLSQVSALGANEAYLAHGDVQGNGRCGVMVWKSGKPTGLAAGTWKLYRLHGPSTAHLDDGVAVEQIIASAGLEKGCPLVN